MNNIDIMTFVVEEYLKYHDKYSQTYGKEKTLVLMQVGSFYEAYSTDTLGPNLNNISNLINVVRTKKNKKIPEVNLENPYFLGFPTVSITKFMEILINSGYTVVVIDQILSDEKKKKRESREVIGIYSRGTYIENIDQKDSNYIICVYLSSETQLNGSTLICSGLSAVDLTTGKTIIHNAYSTPYDQNFAMDETSRFIHSLGSKEIIIYYDKNEKTKIEMTRDYIISYLEITDDICRFNYFDNSKNQKYKKITFQNEILQLLYPESKSLVSPIEHFNLENNIYGLISFGLLISFISDKNKNLLNNLSKPELYADGKYLVLGNNAISQLNILDFGQIPNEDVKFKSLFQVVNKTSTALGGRYLRTRLMSPLLDINELNGIYDLVDFLKENNVWKDIEKYLDNIKDIEKLCRKMELFLIKPYEIILLISSYENILELSEYIRKKKSKVLSNVNLSKETIEYIKNFLEFVKNKFDLTELAKYMTFDIETSIFNVGMYPDIDKIKQNINLGHEFIEKLRTKLNGYIKNNNKNVLFIKKNTREGYYFNLTNMRATELKNKFETIKEIVIDGYTIHTKSLIFKDCDKMTKIYLPMLNNNSNNIKEYNDQIESLNKKYYLETLKEIKQKYSNMFDPCNQFVTKLDYVKSTAKTALCYNYVRPILESREYGYIESKNIRHPIVERIIDHEYIPHNVKIGDPDMKGMLLYGINSSGKSIFMKTIGLLVIMAQAGLYVPATTFKLSPYRSLYTRITGNDNIFKGLSSFSLEMVELNAILKRADKNTLVIGDEVCRGTEHISGNAIVATTILKLSELKASFIFATHLHEIVTLEEIKKLTNVKPYHLSVSYDAKTDSLVYDRNLKEGTGEQIYGLTVAKYIIHDHEFIDMAMKIKNELMKTKDEIISGKTSKYNKNVFVYECCICGKNENTYLPNLETHHINFQKNCENGFVKNKQHIKKNQKSNLIVLCSQCHDKIHDGSLEIEGYKMTTKGKSVVVDEKNKNKI